MPSLRGLRGKKDVYTCGRCGKHICTVVAEDGIPAAAVICRFNAKCGGLMLSHMFDVDQALPAAFEWRRPKEETIPFLPPHIRQYIEAGGLQLFKIGERDDPIRRD